ncbi:MAG TPA: uroporphyrinogen-III synthase [Candidatus Limnocylindrales bacterium]|nr:uroporphyrinogen-III synthase [Candidatus Limnocylindrales bacterium]
MGEKNSKPLARKRVVITRALEQSQSLVDALREAGAEPVLFPLVAFAPTDNLVELDACLKNSARFDWVFFTSQNALRAVQQRCAAMDLPVAKVFSGVKIAAVGPATAEAVAAAGLAVDFISRIHTGVALAEELSAEEKRKRVLLPRSDRANPDLIEVLNLHGWQVTPVVAYKTVSPDADSSVVQESLLRGDADAILFFSPSAVHHLHDLLGLQRFRDLSRQSIFVAIGPVSESALKAEGIERVLQAADTSVSAAVSTLSDYFARAGQHQPAGAKQG